MKIIATGFLLVAAMFPGNLPFQSSRQQVQRQVMAEEALQNKVKIYDFEGNLLKEMKSKDVANGDISVTDYFVLESSGFAFNYLGDDYYLKD